MTAVPMAEPSVVMKRMRSSAWVIQEGPISSRVTVAAAQPQLDACGAGAPQLGCGGGGAGAPQLGGGGAGAPQLGGGAGSSPQTGSDSSYCCSSTLRPT